MTADPLGNAAEQCPGRRPDEAGRSGQEAGSLLHLPRLIVSSSRGGGGKTLLSLGLARALRRRGYTVVPFKKGPDYIDAAWLSAAAGLAATNLDPYFLDAAGLRAQMGHALAGLVPEGSDNTLALVEGNRGLFDGLDLQGSCSTATLARALQAPVLLTLTVTKQTRTVAALLQGLQHFEEGLSFAGVVLNATGSSRHAAAVRAAIEHYTDFRVLGELPRLRSNPLPERHMGLASFLGDRLSESAEKALDDLADYVAGHVDLAAIVQSAREASAVDCPPFWTTPPRTLPDPPVIGYVRDACLWFYYRENLEALERAGARLVKLSLFDKDWPLDELDGLYLGGGFPEDYAKDISESALLQAIARLSARGMPIYAECGGFMILCRSLSVHGTDWPMAGILPLDIDLGPRPCGLGYVQARVVADNPFHAGGSLLLGHEFHYSKARSLEPGSTILALDRGMGLQGGMDGMVVHNTWGSYTHIFAPRTPSWAPTFCDMARAWRRQQQGADSPA